MRLTIPYLMTDTPSIVLSNTDHSVPVISVIMPVYNGEKYLCEALNNILNQSFGDFELIIVDDSSHDRSQEIIHSYSDPRIKLVKNQKNLGVVGALNIGLKVATGKYLVRHDQDDRSHLDRFKLQYLAMEKLGVDICGTGWTTMSPEGALLKQQQNPCNEDTIFACLATNVPFPHGSVMMRSSFLKKHQLQYDDQNYFGDDYWLWVRFAQNDARFANLRENLYFYRIHSQSLSFQKNNLVRKAAKRIRRDFVKKNITRSKDTLDRLTLNLDTIKSLNHRETVYASMLAYRLPLSWNSSAKFMKIFWHASMKQKMHILYTIIKS